MEECKILKAFKVCTLTIGQTHRKINSERKRYDGNFNTGEKYSLRTVKKFSRENKLHENERKDGLEWRLTVVLM